MRRRIPSLLVALSVGWSTPVLAQVPDWVNQILTAAQLPVATSEARREGIRSDEIRTALDAMRRAGLPAHEATVVIDTARAVRREQGPVDNFGAFVQSQLAAGKRGRELAAAIRAEHARQGKGGAARGAMGQGRGQGQGQGRGPGQSRDDADTLHARGRGNAQPRGKPEARDQKQGERGRGRDNPTPPNR